MGSGGSREHALSSYSPFKGRRIYSLSRARTFSKPGLLVAWLTVPYTSIQAACCAMFSLAFLPETQVKPGPRPDWLSFWPLTSIHGWLSERVQGPSGANSLSFPLHGYAWMYESQDGDLVLTKAVNRLNSCFLSQLLTDSPLSGIIRPGLSAKVAVFSAAAGYCIFSNTQEFFPKARVRHSRVLGQNTTVMPPKLPSLLLTMPTCSYPPSTQIPFRLQTLEIAFFFLSSISTYPANAGTQQVFSAT